MWLYRIFKSEKAFKYDVRDFAYEPLHYLFKEEAFYPDKMASGIQLSIFSYRGELINRHVGEALEEFSILRLNGMLRGKTEYEVIYPTFWDFSQKLKPASEYSYRNRIGYETNEDFEFNCHYVLENEAHISGLDDKKFHIYHRLWDNKCFLANHDGAHHFAAIYRQAIAQSRDFRFQAYIDRHTLNRDLYNRFLKNNLILFLPEKSGKFIRKLVGDYGYIVPTFHEYLYDRVILDFFRDGMCQEQ